MGTMHQVLGVHSVPSTEIWPLNSSIKKRKELLVHPIPLRLYQTSIPPKKIVENFIYSQQDVII